MGLGVVKMVCGVNRFGVCLLGVDVVLVQGCPQIQKYSKDVAPNLNRDHRCHKRKLIGWELCLSRPVLRIKMVVLGMSTIEIP